ncbi:MAG: 23S rRNA (adenine(2503)-C(2))-methyltransferase RlmN [Deltaproteobacteria bacterium]|nr:23S rRNA (adenine(2503)-C(2))-methyltransferase RlmN [Deltaproteobacteria bacterium]
MASTSGLALMTVLQLRTLDLRGFSPAELKERVVALGHPAYRAEQVFRWLHGPGAGGMGAVKDPSAPCNVPAALRDTLANDAAPVALRLDVEQKAADGTRKFAFLTHEGRSIEAVLIPDDNKERDRLTLCISSQVGCAIDCKFCATATLGFGRHLTAGEIVSQVYWATEIGGRRPTNIVFMGMGEPLHNFDNVRRAFELLCHPWGAAFSPRRVTISTSGLVNGIEKLSALEPVPNLAISLNASSDEVRDQIMPINKKWPIAALMQAVKAFPLGHGRKVTFEYVMLAGVNDSDVDADRLGKLVSSVPCMVNLIPWNPFNGPKFQRPSTERVLAFQARVRAKGVPVYVRIPRGDDIDAACGQLAARAPAPPKDVDVSLLRALRTPAAP